MAHMNKDRAPRSVLLIAYHFPPFAGSSGLHRTVALARYLQDYGWKPIVLTVRSTAYENVADPPYDLLHPDIPICRIPALDAARHLAIRGRYPRVLSLPDRWVSWLAGAIPAGLALIVRHRPRVLWSTYPIASAHLIAWALRRLSGLPWIADFRDPMVEYIDDTWYPRDAALRRSRLIVERRVAAGAAATTFCTATARDIFLDRHGHHSHPRLRSLVIENGFDEADFEAASSLLPVRATGGVHLVHSGTLYPGPDRDPSALLRAIASLRDRGLLPAGFRLTLRATGFDQSYRPVIDRLRLAPCVELAPPLGHHRALREIMDADGLVLIQGCTSNPAIPAKAYEYLRAGRPILALVDPQGETAALLARVGIGTQAPVQDQPLVERALEEFLRGIRDRSHRILGPAEVSRLARRERVREFACLMDTLASAGSAAVT